MSNLPSPLGSAALQYARAGWPVFPCREHDGEPYVDRKTGETKIAKAKAPYVGNGLKDATTDEATIAGWWRRWPNAAIGVAMDRNGLFAVDFDPRVDEETGEIFTLERLKGETEAQIGAEIPSSLVAVTPSGGVHVYLRQPDDGGERIRNRGNLPLHVDVRGRGGYVIVPPSRIMEPCVSATAGSYRWLRGRQDIEPANAPPSLIEALRAPKVRAQANAAGDKPASSSSSPRPGAAAGTAAALAPDDAADDTVRRYALSALESECRQLAAVPLGGRDNASNASGFAMGQLVGAGALSEGVARAALHDAVSAFGDPPARRRAIDNGIAAGIAQPRDLAEIAERARQRASRPSRASSAPRPHQAPKEGNPSDWKPEAANNNDGAGGDDDADDLHRRCIFHPHTDLGNAERFRARFGDDFRWSPALGWLGWDGRRWVPLKQEEKSVPSEVLDAVFRTVRAIQDEGDVIENSGMEDEGGLDQVIWLSDKKSTTRAAVHRKWGRTSEAHHKLTCIARLAQPWLAVRDDAFDADPLTINLLNGTLRFSRERRDGRWVARWKLDAHSRADLISKLAPVIFDRSATCPRYDDVMAWAQDLPEMRRYLHQWGGLSMTGDMGEQKLHFWYGLGGNGKSTVMDAWCSVLGDYTTTIPIETFLDQGVKRRGDQATPELARLGGVRLLRTSEPERGAKLAAALIKLITGGEPMSVRHLHRGFFDLRPIFKMTIGGNFRPEIPDTDEGIWRRVKLVPWPKNIDHEPPHADGTPKKDPTLPEKLRAETSGILNRLVDGLLDWLENGLVEPEEVARATREYRTESDPLARFLKLCTRPEPEGRVQSSHLHALFVAWCKAAGEREWSQKGFSKAMLDKGFEKKASDGMQWLGIVTTRREDDFVDAHGHPRPFSIDDSDDENPGRPPPVGAAEDDLPPL